MRWDILICVIIFPLIPLSNALLIRWRFNRREQRMSFFQTGILFLALCIIAMTLGNILWMLIGIGSGVAQAIFTDTTFNEGLRLGFDRAVPLNEQEDLIAWGLLPPVLVGLSLNIIAHFVCMRVIKLTDSPACTPDALSDKST